MCHIHSGTSLQGTSRGWIMCHINSGTSLQGTIKLGVAHIMSHTQWSLSTRDKSGVAHVSNTQWNLSTRDKLGVAHVSHTQWNLSTRDKLGVAHVSHTQWSLIVLTSSKNLNNVWVGELTIINSIKNITGLC